MNRNTGTIDRSARAIIGIVMMGIGFGLLSGGAAIAVGVIGIILFSTGAIGWCPLYIPLRINTRKI